MSEHPAYTLAGLCAGGGLFGFLRTRSIPSLVGGVGLGLAFAHSAYRIERGQRYGYELAAATSILLIASSAPRFRAGAVPKVLTGVGLAGGGYYGKKVSDFGVGA